MPIDVQPLIDAWRRASVELRTEIGQMAEQAADRAAARIRDAYPEGPTGNLRAGVRIGPPRGWTKSEGALVPARVVRSTAPHTHFIERGIAGRRRVAPRVTFVPIAIDERQSYLRAAQALLDRDRTVL